VISTSFAIVAAASNRFVLRGLHLVALKNLVGNARINFIFFSLRLDKLSCIAYTFSLLVSEQNQPVFEN